MVGVVLFAHAGLAGAFRRAATEIVGDMPAMEVVDIDPACRFDEMERALDDAINRADEGHGVLVLTDLFGGSPANFSLARMKPGRVEVVCGLNLAMLLKVFDLRQHGLTDVGAMAQAVARSGRENVVVASSVLAPAGAATNSGAGGGGASIGAGS